jgi:hypothetical protein
MHKRYFEYTITARPHWHKRRPRVRKRQTCVIVARTALEATVLYLNKAGRMKVLSCVRGKQVEAPRPHD